LSSSKDWWASSHSSKLRSASESKTCACWWCFSINRLCA
jgi:hypothetical protein